MPHENRGGFTLIEVVVVIGVIAVLVAPVLPAVQAACEAARRAQCTQYLRQIAIGMQTYLNAMETLPPGYVSTILTPAQRNQIGSPAKNGDDGGGPDGPVTSCSCRR